MSGGVAPPTAYLRVLREERMKLAAIRERELRPEILAKIDAALELLDAEIWKRERQLIRRVAPREYLKLMRIDREMGALSLQLAATPRRSLPQPRRRSRRVVRRARARSSGREPDDPEPGLARPLVDDDLAASTAEAVARHQAVAEFCGMSWIADLIDAELTRLSEVA